MVLLTRKSKVPRKPLLPPCLELPLDTSLEVLHASRQWTCSGESHCTLASAPIRRLLQKKLNCSTVLQEHYFTSCNSWGLQLYKPRVQELRRKKTGGGGAAETKIR